MKEVLRMKRRILALLMILLLVFCSGCRKATLEGYKLFRSTPLGLSVEYPHFWEETHSNKEGIVAFVTPAEGYSDEYRENLSVQRFTLDMEGENAYNEYIKGYVANLEGTLQNYNKVTEQDTTLAGMPAYKIVYESSSDDGADEMRFMQMFVARGEKVYVVTYVADFASYEYFLTDVEKMLTTFAFI